MDYRREELIAPICTEQAGPKIGVYIRILIVHKKIDHKKGWNKNIHGRVELEKGIGQSPEFFKYRETDDQWEKCMHDAQQKEAFG